MACLLCGCLTDKSVDRMVTCSVKAQHKLDLFEARIDFLDSFDGLDQLSEIRKTLITTCMPLWEGGHFSLDEDERLKIMSSCLGFSDYVTYEYQSEKARINQLIEQARKQKVKVILASHDFDKTPSKIHMRDTLDGCFDLGADIAKIAYKPNTFQDVVNLLSVLREYPKGKVIALSMGLLGRISRILAPSLGSPLTYAKIEGTQKAGEGQYTISQLAEIRKVMSW